MGAQVASQLAGCKRPAVGPNGGIRLAMSLAPPQPPPPRLRAFRRDAAVFSPVQSRALSGRVAPQGRSLGSLGRAYCVFSGGGARLDQVRVASPFT
jgi:hypothetical protein